MSVRFLAAVAMAVPATLGAEQPSLEQGRQLTNLLLSGDIASLEARLAPSFLKAIGGHEGLVRFAGRVREQAGSEQQVLSEAVFAEAGFVSYYRVSRFAKVPDVTARWVIGPDGLVAGFTLMPTQQPASTPYLDYRTKTRLRLPFGAPAQQGGWYVAWGGRDLIHNYHAIAADQRFAYDFLVMRGDAISSGDGTRNEDFFCWGEPVRAPAAGTVVEAVGDQPDNARPRTFREGVPPPGNHVVIDHGDGEYSLIAHFRQGSLAVHKGERVQSGALLGVCGNSGHSDLPHVHYHLQTGAAYGQGLGLPAAFENYVSNGRAVGRGEPVRGEWLLPGR